MLRSGLPGQRDSASAGIAGPLTLSPPQLLLRPVFAIVEYRPRLGVSYRQAHSRVLLPSADDLH